MQTLIGILVQPHEEHRIETLINAMQARKHWLTVDECLWEILHAGVAGSEKLYLEGDGND